MNKLILASTSPRRKDLIERLKIPFEIVESNYDEDFELSDDPKELTRILATGKAEAVAKNYPDAVVLGADTVIVVGNTVLGKAKDVKDAVRMLKLLAGKEHQAVTSYTILHKSKNKKITKTSICNIHMRPLSDKEIESFVRFNDSVGFAGAYAIQNHGAFLVDRVEGDVNTIIGLPVADVVEDLKRFGIHVL